MEDKYSTNKSVRDLVRHHKMLKLDRNALKTMESSVKFYDKFSHPTRLSLGAIITLDGDGSQIVFGGIYDPGKDFAYKKELKSKNSLASVLPKIIEGVMQNFESKA